MIGDLLERCHRPVYTERFRVLSGLIAAELRPGDRVLDVGCGDGALARSVLGHPACPGDLRYEGVESAPRGDAPFVVHPYDGRSMPFADESVDAVVLADVLHHAAEPYRLMAECARVARRIVIVKDHQVAGPLAQQRISLMDWAANVRHGVPCSYRYLTARQWDAFPARFGLTVQSELRSIRLYPPVWNAAFGNRLQYLAVFAKPVTPSASGG
jgi:SAM-dependent methyltransferase